MMMSSSSLATMMPMDALNLNRPLEEPSGGREIYFDFFLNFQFIIVTNLIIMYVCIYLFIQFYILIKRI